MSLARGTVVLVDLEPSRGHEQQGTRPCVVVSDSAVNSSQRFPLIAVVPITGTPAAGALYPALAPGASGLSKPSTALVDQVRSIDKQRIRRRYGLVSAAELEAIDNGLILYLGIEPDPKCIRSSLKNPSISAKWGSPITVCPLDVIVLLMLDALPWITLKSRR